MLALENIVGIGLDHIHTCMGCQLSAGSSPRIWSTRMVLDIARTCSARNPHKARLPQLRRLPSYPPDALNDNSLNIKASCISGMFFISS